MIRVILPTHLRTLSGAGRIVELDVPEPCSLAAVLDCLETRFPMLRGAIRDQVTRVRRPFIRFFACELDLSHEPSDSLLPEAVRNGSEPLRIVGAMAGG